MTPTLTRHSSSLALVQELPGVSANQNSVKVTFQATGNLGGVFQRLQMQALELLKASARGLDGQAIGAFVEDGATQVLYQATAFILFHVILAEKDALNALPKKFQLVIGFGHRQFLHIKNTKVCAVSHSEIYDYCDIS